jgi:hypothetical protein
MDTAIISALSAVLGSLVGGGASFATAWVNQKNQGRRKILLAQIERRQALYGEFITECSKLAIDAMDHSLEDPRKLFEVYALQNRIRLTSSDAVVAAGETTVRMILRQYYAPNLKSEDFQRMVMTPHPGTDSPNDPLRPFSEACRRELAELHGAC